MISAPPVHARLEPRGNAFVRESFGAGLWRELGAALRALRRSPRYSVPGFLSVALGTGASLGIFAVFSALTLRPLPFSDAERLVTVGFPGASEWAGPDVLSMSHPLVGQFREYGSVFEAVTARRDLLARLEIPGRGPMTPVGERVPLDFFDTLGVIAEQGRTFSARGASPDGRDVVVLRRGFWLEELGGVPLIGEVVRVNGVPKTVIGIVADEQALPSWAALWDPVDLAEGVRPGSFYFTATARLASGVSPAMAQERLSQLTAKLDVRTPAGDRVGVRVVPLRDTLVQAETSWLRLMSGAVLSFFLLSCANLSALLATRASVRQSERAVCSALGAGRRRLVAQSLLESFLLVLSGSVAGLGLAQLGIDLANHHYADVLGNTPARVDRWVLGGLSALVMACTLAAAAGPVLATRRVRPMDALAGGGRASDGRTATRLQNGLVATQVALTVVLLISACLLVRSLQATLAIDPGFESDQVLTAHVALSVPPRDGSEESFLAQKDDGQRQVQALLERVQRVPGVLHATVSGDVPFDYFNEQLTMELEPGNKRRSLPAVLHNVGPGHFETLGIRLISGRLFGPEDQRAWPPQTVAIVSQNLAREALGVENAVGHRFRLAAAPGSPERPWIEIIGMVESTRETSLTEPAPPSVYWPFFAYPTRGVNQDNFMAVVALKVSGPVEKIAVDLRAAIRDVLPSAAVVEMKPLSDWLGQSYARRTALSHVLSALALAAVALSVIGLFGVTSYSVARRSSEIAIRRALGASGKVIRRMILRETGAVVTAGLLVGSIGAWLARRLIEGFLFGISAEDPFTYAGVSLGVLSATSAAALMAARSATRIAPSRALAGR